MGDQAMLNVTEERARAGHIGDGVRVMLAFSLALSLAALAISLLAYAR
jgi:hypothetical protein